jgi:hypothetical protein
MSDRQSYQRRAFAESVAAYGSSAPIERHTKLSISLPADLVELVRGAASDQGVSVSAVIAASLRRTIEEADQARLDAAIEAQNQENLEWAKAYKPLAAKLLSELEW